MSDKQLANRLQNLDIIKDKVPKTTTINSKPLTTNIVLTKNELGLSDVDNTSDADKPASKAVLDALAKKENISNKNIANGYAGLNNSTQLNLSLIPINPTFSNMVSLNKSLKFANSSWLQIMNTTAETTIPLIVVQSNFPLTTSTSADGIFQINLDAGKFCSISGAISVFTGGVTLVGSCTSRVYIDGSLYSTKTHSTAGNFTSTSHQIIYTNPPPLSDTADNITFRVSVSFLIPTNNQARLTAFFFMV